MLYRPTISLLHGRGLLKPGVEPIDNGAFVCESVTVLTFEQLFCHLVHAFSAELLTVLSCDNLSNPVHPKIIFIYLDFF